LYVFTLTVYVLQHSIQMIIFSAIDKLFSFLGFILNFWATTESVILVLYHIQQILLKDFAQRASLVLIRIDKDTG